MPQLTQAKKALRTSQRKRVINDRWRRKLRAALNEVRDALANNSKKDAEKAMLKAESILDRTARRNIIHPNKASRKKSRLRQAIAKIESK